MRASPTITDSRDLADAILDVFPSGSYAMSGLLRLLDVVATTAVATAAVECRAQPRMLINPDFVAKHAQTPEKLLMLVMHELHHVLLGHTTLFPRITPAQNLVFDAVVNGVICRMFPDEAYTSFFTDYYRDDQFPDCLLRPPKGWPKAGFDVSPGLRNVDAAWRQRAQEVHAALYSEGGASYREVYELLPRLITKAGEDGLAGVPLIGGHDTDQAHHQDLQQISPLMFDLVRDLVEHWPQPPDPIRGRSLADVLRESSVVPATKGPLRSRRSVLRGLIRKLAGISGCSPLQHASTGLTRIQSPLPTMSRRAAVLQAIGVPSLLHPADIPWRQRRQGGSLVHIYLDVSGSMNEILGPLYGAALDCQDLLYPKVHLFSTKVVDITPAQLRQGRCVTTGGTSINPVALHMAANRVNRALVVTDGWVGKPEGPYRKTLEDVHLGVAYIGQETNQSDLAGVANHTAIISIGEA